MENTRWQISVSIFKNNIILKQLGIALGIPFGVLIIFFIIIKAYYGLCIIALLFAITWLFIMVVYRGRYDVEFVLDNKGVLCKTQEKQANKNKVINALTVFIGFLSGKYAVAGAGMLAQSRQVVFLKWNRIKKVKIKEKGRMIIIKGGFSENIAIFCDESNYLDVLNIVKERTAL